MSKEFQHGGCDLHLHMDAVWLHQWINHLSASPCTTSMTSMSNQVAPLPSFFEQRTICSKTENFRTCKVIEMSHEERLGWRALGVKPLCLRIIAFILKYNQFFTNIQSICKNLDYFPIQGCISLNNRRLESRTFHRTFLSTCIHFYRINASSRRNSKSKRDS